MRTAIDFKPLYKSSIGFDRLIDLLEDAARGQTADNWPPYDIIKVDEASYRIAIAVAGFSEKELNISVEPNLLVIAGDRAAEPTGEILHRGIASRAFTRRFELADHIKVTSASLANGLLTIDLRREIPEEMRSRRVEIRTAVPSVARPIDDNAQAAA